MVTEYIVNIRPAESSLGMIGYNSTHITINNLEYIMFERIKGDFPKEVMELMKNSGIESIASGKMSSFCMRMESY